MGKTRTTRCSVRASRLLILSALQPCVLAHATPAPSPAQRVPATAAVAVMWYGGVHGSPIWGRTALGEALSRPQFRTMPDVILRYVAGRLAAPALVGRELSPRDRRHVRSAYRQLLSLALRHVGYACLLPDAPDDPGRRDFAIALRAGRQIVTLVAHIRGLVGGTSWPPRSAGGYPAFVRPGRPKPMVVNVAGWPAPDWLVVASTRHAYAVAADAVRGRSPSLADQPWYATVASQFGADPPVIDLVAHSARTHQRPWSLGMRVGLYRRGFRTAGSALLTGGCPLLDGLSAQPLEHEAARLAPTSIAAGVVTRVKPDHVGRLLAAGAGRKARAAAAALDGVVAAIQPRGASPSERLPVLMFGVRDANALRATLDRLFSRGRAGPASRARETRPGNDDTTFWRLPATQRAAPFRFIALDSRRLTLAASAAAQSAARRPASGAADWTTGKAWRFCRRHAGARPHVLITSDPRVTAPSWCLPPMAVATLTGLGPGMSLDELATLGELGRHLFPGVTGLWRTPTGLRWVAYEPLPIASLLPDAAIIPSALKLPAVRRALGFPSGSVPWPFRF